MLFQNTRRIKPLRALNGLGKCLSKKHSVPDSLTLAGVKTVLTKLLGRAKIQAAWNYRMRGGSLGRNKRLRLSKQILIYGQTRFFSAPAVLPLDCTATGRAASDKPTVPPSRIRAATRRASISA